MTTRASLDRCLTETHWRGPPSLVALYATLDFGIFGYVVTLRIISTQKMVEGSTLSKLFHL
jgi:hypothetical protein